MSGYIGMYAFIDDTAGRTQAVRADTAAIRAKFEPNTDETVIRFALDTGALPPAEGVEFLVGLGSDSPLADLARASAALWPNNGGYFVPMYPVNDASTYAIIVNADGVVAIRPAEWLDEQPTCIVVTRALNGSFSTFHVWGAADDLVTSLWNAARPAG